MCTAKVQEVRKYVLPAAALLFVGTALGAAGGADVTITKPYIRWLFGGFGFQNSEANFVALMPDDFRDQRVLKTFAEISPSFSRVYTGFADETKEQLDRFADYYDLTFRKAGTTLYAVPCAMPAFAEKLDADEYAEKVAKNLEYLIKTRNCRKIRYYCLTNELMNGDRWGWFAQKGQWELFKKFNVALYFAFRRHDLDIRLLASDESASPNPEAAKNVYSMLDWIRTNMGDYVGAYCTHWYVYGRKADDLNLWRESNASFSNLVQRALSSNAKRYILGEFGFSPTFGKRGVMVDDRSYNLRQPETCEESVLSKCEVGLAAMSQGTFACVSWSFVDYPDPFVIEDGDSPQERAVYEAGKCGYRLDTKYNKWGVFRWCSTDRDYRAYAELYAMGWLAKLFRKNATVLPCAFADPMLRGGAVINPDQSVSIALVNRGPAKTVSVDCSSWKSRIDGAPSFHQPFRRYVYEVGHVPYNAFNDLQPPAGTVTAKDGAFSVALPAKSITFLTTDYVDRQPAAVTGLRIAGRVLAWEPSEEPEHRYYRVYKDGKQIASTVATSLNLGGAQFAATASEAINCVPPGGGRDKCVPPVFAVKSVDKWNNVRK